MALGLSRGTSRVAVIKPLPDSLLAEAAQRLCQAAGALPHHLLISTLLPLTRPLQLPGVSLSDADAFHKAASEEWSASGVSQAVAPHVLSSCVPGLDMSDHALGVAAAMLFANLQVCSAMCLDITAELPLPPPPPQSHASSQGGGGHSMEQKWNGKCTRRCLYSMSKCNTLCISCVRRRCPS